jgi:hypothetical protein
MGGKEKGTGLVVFDNGHYYAIEAAKGQESL